MEAGATTISTTRAGGSRPVFFVLGYLAIYCALLFSMRRFEGFDLSEPLLVLALMGFGFTALAWLVTRNSTPLPFVVAKAGRESALLLVYTVPLVVYLTWGRKVLALSTIPEPRQSVVILLIKLLLFVAIPVAILGLASGCRWRDLFVFDGSRRHVWPALGMSLAMIAFQCVLGTGLSGIRHSGSRWSTLAVAAPFLYLFLLLEVGLVEEFFFACSYSRGLRCGSSRSSEAWSVCRYSSALRTLLGFTTSQRRCRRQSARIRRG